MAGKLFLIHWNSAEAEELAQPFRAEGWDVEIEAKDGARAGKRIGQDPPDVVVIYLTRLPSLGRETAHCLRSTTATQDVPVVFVDGKGEALDKTQAKVPAAMFTTSDKLKGVLAELGNAA